MAAKDTGSFPALTPGQLRGAATLLAGLAGAGVGTMVGVAYLLWDSGESRLSIAVGVVSLILTLVLLFLVLQARVVAQLIEHRPPLSGHALERRLYAIERRLVEVETRRLDTDPPLVIDEIASRTDA